MVVITSKRLILTLILSGVGLSACGYKAPVYYPTPEQRKALQEKEARIEARKQAFKRQQEEQTQTSDSSSSNQMK